MRFKTQVQLVGLVLLVVAIAAFSRFQAQGAPDHLQSTAAATGAAAPTITPTPLPTLHKDMMGVQAYANLGPQQWSGPNGIMDLTRFMGFKWIKVQLSWKELESSK